MTLAPSGTVIPLADPFAELAGLGYGDRLIPVIPPGAPVEPGGALARKIAAGRDDRGKAPGLRNSDGRWFGLPGWQKWRTTPDNLREWRTMGASAGLRCGDGLMAIDCDVDDLVWSRRIAGEIERRLGVLPKRVGKAPRFLVMLRVKAPFSLTKIRFDYGEIDFRSGGQFVAGGVHQSGRPYEWTSPLVRYDELPAFAPEEVGRLGDALGTMLPGARKTTTRIPDGGAVDPIALLGDETRLRWALSAIINDERCDSREIYIKIVYACRGASGGAAWGLAALQEWAATWQSGENDPAVVEADFRSASETHIGIGWLENFACGMSCGAFNAVVSRFFEHPQESLFPDNDNVSPDGEGTSTITSAAVEADGAYALERYAHDPARLPRRAMLYGGHYIRQFVSATFAQSKVGKSSLMLPEVLSLIIGRGLLGIAPAESGLRVWWHCEDPRHEMDRKIAAAGIFHGLSAEEIGLVQDRLFLTSDRRSKITLAKVVKGQAELLPDVIRHLRITILKFRIDVLILDPFIKIHRLSEKDSDTMDLVLAALNALAEETNCAIELIHHVRKLAPGAEATIDDGRGSTAIVAAARSVRALSRMTPKEAAQRGVKAPERATIFRLSDTASNMFPPPLDADERWLRTVSVALGNGPGEGSERFIHGDHVGVATIYKRESGGSPDGSAAAPLERALALIRSVPRWRADPQAAMWIGRPIADALGLAHDDKADRPAIRAALDAMLKAGWLRTVYEQDEQRHDRQFIRAADLRIFD